MKTEPNQSAYGYGFTTSDGSSHVNESGLTKIEYFGSLAMQGILSNTDGGMTESGTKTLSPTGVSYLAILHAKELIKQLNEL